MANNSTNEYLKLLNELRAYNIPKNILDSLSSYLKFIYRSELENHFSAPMLWIGIYIALASLVCILAMVADLVHGFRSKKLWFPCKYFRINSAFLTIISVAMKLPVDLTGSMPGTVDQVAKLGSMAFMCTMMANLLPCLATMDDNDLLSNIVALCVLVITLVVNVCIQIQTGVVSIQTYNQDRRITELVSPRRHVKSIPMAASIRNYTTLHIIYVTLLLVLLVIYVCSSLAIVQSKKAIESEYQKRHHKALQESQPSRGQFSLFDYVVKHWIMARTGSSQFVFTAFFPTTSVAGVICVFVTVLHILTMSWTIEAILAKDYDSDYSWSMILIVIVQFIGVVIGTIVPLSRCFAPFTRLEVMSLKMILDYIKVFELESYWTRKLYDWKHASIRLRFYNLEMVIETLKRLVLSICIGFQKGVVVVCKIIALVPFFFFLCVLYCFRRLRLKDLDSFFSVDILHNALGHDISRYLLLLKNEMLSIRTLKVLLNSLFQLIFDCENSQPKFIELIQRESTRDFDGVKKFDQIDSNHVPSTSEVQYYRECWRLSVVTLTTIAVSLPEIEKNEVEELLNCVRGGLEYVAIVEENLNVSYDFVRTQKAAETLWQEVDALHSWLDNKLQDPSFHMRTAGQIIEWFEDTANKIVDTMKDKITGDPASGENDDLIHKSICAYSMSRIANKQLLTCCTNSDHEVSQQELFDSFTSMIADVIAACLTNLPQIITMKCHTTEIEEREESVKDAALKDGIFQTWIHVTCHLLRNGVLILGNTKVLKKHVSSSSNEISLVARRLCKINVKFSS